MLDLLEPPLGAGSHAPPAQEGPALRHGPGTLGSLRCSQGQEDPLLTLGTLCSSR